MHQHQDLLSIESQGQGLIELTGEIARIVAAAQCMIGLVHIYCRHTSCSLLIQENADPDVQRDLLAFFKRLAPEGDMLFVHTTEGPDDMPAHIKAALTQTALTIPITNGKMVLGTWQGIYLFEHRRRPHTREIVVHVTGD